MDLLDELTLGRESYRRQAWAAAYQALSQADQTTPLGVEDLELLATSAYLSGREDEFLRVLERAHQAHLHAGDSGRAARCAFWVGIRLFLRGETGRATGWLARAQRLLEQRDCVEQGYLLRSVATQQLAAGTSMSTNQLAGEAQHIDAWHGSLSDPFPNLAIQALFNSSIGAPAGHTRTYLGFSDGSIGWLVNACQPNPSTCSAYRYVTGDHWVDLPTWHGTFHASVKALHHFSVTGPVVNTGNNVTLEGEVPSVVDRAKAGELALGTDGVKKVNNKLKLKK